MTIAAAWVRTLDTGAQELIVCSDSRLSDGKRFDHCQKIFRFERCDSAICFAGRTDWAYPMLVAAINAVGIHLPSQTRALSLAKFKTHLVNILNQMQSEVHNFAKGENIPEVTFIFGGYDWWKKCFRIWRVTFDPASLKFTYEERKGSNKFGSLGRIEFAGDTEWCDAFRTNLKALAQERHGKDMGKAAKARFNLEPFEVIRDLVSQATPDDSIGGAPQAVKVYQFQNSTDIGIFWPSVNDGRLFLAGRPLLEYERATIRSVIDPQTLNSSWSSGSTAHALEQIARANAADNERCGDEDSEGFDEDD